MGALTPPRPSPPRAALAPVRLRPSGGRRADGGGKEGRQISFSKTPGGRGCPLLESDYQTPNLRVIIGIEGDIDNITSKCRGEGKRMRPTPIPNVGRERTTMTAGSGESQQAPYGRALWDDAKKKGLFAEVVKTTEIAKRGGVLERTEEGRVRPR